MTMTIDRRRAPSSWEPTIRLVPVKPSLAEHLLTHNTHNRSVRREVYSFAADMRAGKWVLNGETLKFAAGDCPVCAMGTLLDGQHRLLAVIEADVTVPLLIVSGLPDTAQETVDVGARRTFADVLRLRGELNVHLLASLTRRVALWDMGERRLQDSAPPLSVPALSATLERYPELREYASAAHGVAARCGLPSSLVGWAMWLFHRIDHEDAAHFFDRLGSDQRHAEGEPIYALRRVAAERHAATRNKGRSWVHLAALTIKAWNAYRDGRQVFVLRYRSGGASPEAFPEPY